MAGEAGEEEKGACREVEVVPRTEQRMARVPVKARLTARCNILVNMVILEDREGSSVDSLTIRSRCYVGVMSSPLLRSGYRKVRNALVCLPLGPGSITVL